MFVSNGIFLVRSSVTIQTGLLSAVLIPNSKKTFGLSKDISYSTRSEVSRFFIISSCIISEPWVSGKIGSKPAFSKDGLNRYSKTW
ncbi:MAG: hypothetical protein OEW67_09475 [Cyclobacteriaceae bacterium]|nr:hypothetical protein [Cyclobacteriaceae bacterium]